MNTAVTTEATRAKNIHLFLIKPSRYDDEGYLVHHFRGVLPSNTLACLYSLTQDAIKTGRFQDVRIQVHQVDETVRNIPTKKIIRLAQKPGVKVIVGLVGVQSNQYPRAADLTAIYREAGIEVIIGGFHVSGVLALFQEIPKEIQQVIDLGASIVAGEVEEVWPEILRDAIEGRLESVYNYLEAKPDLTNAPIPEVDKYYLDRFAVRNFGTIDCGRGCPFNCSFCTIINVQGRTMRMRSAEMIAEAIRGNYKKGLTFYFFTDDNFARNKNWKQILEKLIELREKEDIPITFMMQVDTVATKIDGFLDLACRAGCTQVFIGMESTNPVNLKLAQKTQNHVDEFKGMIAAWHSRGISTHVGFIIGFPHDSPESVRKDLKFLREEVQPDLASFFMLTPLPGSQDHFVQKMNGVEMDEDYNQYDSFHAVVDHPKMSRDEWTSIYEDAWTDFLGFDNMRAVLRRAVSPNQYWDMFRNFIWYHHSACIEKGHPMITGFFRLKGRRNRRPGYPIESRWAYFKQRTVEIKNLLIAWMRFMIHLEELWLQTRIRGESELKFLFEMRSLKGDLLKSLRTDEVLQFLHKMSGNVRTSYGHVRKLGAEKVSALSESLDQVRRMSSEKVTGFSGSVHDRYLHSREEFDKFSAQVAHEFQKLSAHARLGFPSRCRHWISRLNVLAIKNIHTREHLTSYWREMLAHCKSGRFFRLIDPRIPMNLWRESILAVHFVGAVAREIGRSSRGMQISAQ